MYSGTGTRRSQGRVQAAGGEAPRQAESPIKRWKSGGGGGGRGDGGRGADGGGGRGRKCSRELNIVKTVSTTVQLSTKLYMEHFSI